jgi:hypothetical protein
MRVFMNEMTAFAMSAIGLDPAAAAFVSAVCPRLWRGGPTLDLANH